ncbi:MAG: ArnT family glycosyltransferase [Microgenomates group bacterium]
MKLIKEWFKPVILLLVIVGVAFFIRSYNLTSLPVFADEAIYVRWSQVMQAESTLRFLPLSDGKQPLFMWVVIPFLKVFSDPLYAARFVSVLTGIGTLVGIFVASNLLFKSKKVSLISSFIFALSPYAVFFDRLSLADSMLSMFGVWVFIGGILIARTVRLDVALLTGFVLGFAYLTKSPSLFFALMLPSTFLLTRLPKEAKMLHILKLGGLLLVVYVITTGIFNILRLGPNFQLLESRNFDYVYPYSHILTSPLDPLKPYADRILEYYRMIGPLALVFLSLLGLYSFKKYPKEIFLLLIWGLVPVFIVSEFSKTMTARYALFTIPYFVLIAGSIFLENKSKIIKYLSYALLAFFVFQSVSINKLLLTDVEKAPLPRSERSGYLEEWTAGQGIKEISEFLKSEYLKNPDKKIVVGTEGYFGTLPDGLLIYMADTPQVLVIGIGLELDKIPKPLVESEKSGNVTYLVANSTRLFATPEDLGLEIVKSYPKAIKPDGGLETLYLFKVN